MNDKRCKAKRPKKRKTRAVVHFRSLRCGMDVSTRKGEFRWKQILAWTHADVSRDFPYVIPGIAVAPSEWKPTTDEETAEAELLRHVLLADRAEKIKSILGSTLTLEDVFHLKDEQLSKARVLADLVLKRWSPPPLMQNDLKVHLYVWKINTVRKDEQNAKLAAQREAELAKPDRAKALLVRFQELRPHHRSNKDAMRRIIWEDFWEATKDPFSPRLLVLKINEANRVWQLNDSGNRFSPSDIEPFVERVKKKLRPSRK